MAVLTKNYDIKEHGHLKYGHDALGNEIKPEKGYRLLDENEVIQKGDKAFDIYSGWIGGVEKYHAENKHHAYYNGGRWTAWERRMLR